MSKNKMWLFAWTWGGEDHKVVVFADTETYARMIFNLEYMGEVPEGLVVPCMKVDRQELQIYCSL